MISLSKSPEQPVRIPDGKQIAEFMTKGGLESTCVDIAVAPQVASYAMECGDIYKMTPARIKRLAKLLSARYHLSVTVNETPQAGDYALEIQRDPRGEVRLGDIIEDSHSTRVAIGVGMNGNAVTLDVAAAPHILIAGTTGSGKSVLLNTIVCGLLTNATPEQARFLMIDPKQVEMEAYAGIPHLHHPIVTSAAAAVDELAELCNVMDDRYEYMSRKGVKNVSQTDLPRIYCVIDELADLMLTSKKTVENYIVRIAQLGRAAGIHLIIATQSPRAAVVTGLIKANVPTKIALTVSNVRESMVILDHGGAEKLTGRGDALLKLPSGVTETRFQAAYTPDYDINNVCTHCMSYPKPKTAKKKRGVLSYILWGK